MDLSEMKAASTMVQVLGAGAFAIGFGLLGSALLAFWRLWKDWRFDVRPLPYGSALIHAMLAVPFAAIIMWSGWNAMTGG